MKEKLYRSSNGSMLAGVCGGIGEYANIDPTIVRLLTVFLFLGSFGTGLIIYLIAAIIIPRKPEYTNASRSHQYSNSDEEFKRPSDDEVEEVRVEDMKEHNDENEADDSKSKKVNLEK